MSILATVQALVAALTSLVTQTAAAKAALSDFASFLATTI